MNLAQYFREGPMMRDNLRDDNWVHPVLTLLIVLIIAGVVIYLIKSVTAGNNTDKNTDKYDDRRDPVDFAKERYAKGEITKDEFTQIKKELNRVDKG